MSSTCGKTPEENAFKETRFDALHKNCVKIGWYNTQIKEGKIKTLLYIFS